MNAPKKTVHVAIAIIKKNCNSHKSPTQFLVAWRNKKQHQGNCFEFIGGKIETDESAFNALVRECKEEISIDINNASLLKKITHDYDDIIVCLHVFLVTDFKGEPKGMEGQKLQWVSSEELQTLAMPKANDAIKRLAVFNQHYYISKSFDAFESLNSWCDFYCEKLPLNAVFYVRHKPNDNGATHIDEIAVADNLTNLESYKTILSNFNTHRPDVKLILPFAYYEVLNHVTGFHLTHKELLNQSHLSKQTKQLMQDSHVFIAACHDAASLKHAQSIQVDAVTLSPVQATASHPNAKPMEWQGFNTLVKNIDNIPVYALGGMKNNDLKTAIENGALGIAGISMLH